MTQKKRGYPSLKESIMLKKTLALLAVPFVAATTLHATDPFNDPFFQDPFGDDIFKEMMQMQAQMDKMFERMHQRMLQRTQRVTGPIAQFHMPGQSGFADKGDHYELLTTIPESKENHIDIQTQNGMLSITAKVVQEQEQKTPNGIAKSSSVRVYQQAVSLPADADISTISTDYQNGRLIVKIAKKGSASQRTIAPSTAPSHPAVSQGKQTKENNTTGKKDQNSTIKPMTIKSDVPSMS